MVIKSFIETESFLGQREYYTCAYCDVMNVNQWIWIHSRSGIKFIEKRK